MKGYSPFGKQSGSFLTSYAKKESEKEWKEKLNLDLLYDPVIPFLVSPERNINFSPHTDLYVNVQRSVIYNGRKVKTTQGSFAWWMNRRHELHLYNGALFSKEKGQSSVTCYDIDVSQNHMLSERGQMQTHFGWFHPCALSRKGRPLETRRKLRDFLGLGVRMKSNCKLTWKISLRWRKCPKTELGWWWHNSENLPKSIELYTWNKWILRYINYPLKEL